MKKQKIQLIAGAIILVLLVGVLLLFKKTDVLEEDTEEAVSYDVTSLDADSITGLSYLFDGEEMSFTKEGDTWKLDSDADTEIDSDTVSYMASRAADITSDVCIEAVEDLSEYGLDNPQNTITITLSDGSSVSLLVGDSEEISGGYYVKTEEGSDVYVMSSVKYSGIVKDLESVLPEEETTEE